MMDSLHLKAHDRDEQAGAEVPVVIVGAGFSGTVIATLLARSKVRTVVIEASRDAGGGAAYSTPDEAHLLNVPANRMSAFADDPGHFERVIVGQGGGPGDFAQRRVFGDYMRSILADSVASGWVKIVKEFAVRAERHGSLWHVRLADGRLIRASKMVLATGNAPPSAIPALKGAGDRYIDNPWGDSARSSIAGMARSRGRVLLVGTGLTMIDTAISLRNAGFEGRTVALSRRGRVPEPHAPTSVTSVDWEELPSGSLMTMWRWVRARSASVGWRSAVDSLRPHNQRLWRQWSHSDRLRFLRHARAWWDVLRHRVAPSVGETIDEMRASEQLEIIAGRIVSARPLGDKIEVAIKARGEVTCERECFDLVINCTGSQDIGRSSDPLLQSLFQSGQISFDPLGIGLAVTNTNKVVGSQDLWAVGPLTKGHYWEITAVPDIRVQAAQIAKEIAEELHDDRSRREADV